LDRGQRRDAPRKDGVKKECGRRKTSRTCLLERKREKKRKQIEEEEENKRDGERAIDGNNRMRESLSLRCAYRRIRVTPDRAANNPSNGED
jgi:hypothetical protein